MEVKYALLGFLEPQSNYGYELKRLYDRYFAWEKPVLAGQIYSTLGRLKRDGCVEGQLIEEMEKSGGPERIKYKITDIGLEKFRKWLVTPEEPAETLQAALYIKTVLALLRGDNAARYLDRQRHHHLRKMHELTERRRGAELAEKLLIDHAIFHLEADLKWIDMTDSRLNNLRKELNEANN